MPSRLILPEAPADAWRDGVAIWEQPMVIDTYDPVDPGPYPAFLDKRVYQGSSGKVYPLPFHEGIATDSRPREWRAVHLENTWLRLVVLPELGGRLHIAHDKVSGKDIFYRNNVIKPALVGLAGPWIAGGIEFNWPQHHRPATYLPTDAAIEREADGAAIVWCSDHDPFARMKGMHGIRLRPDSSRIEVEARLFNRTDVPHTFLWWANVAAAVNDDYQAFFPSDVTHVADHAKRAVVSFPHPDKPYYGIDYAARAAQDTSGRSGSAHDSYGRGDAGRIDWYRNIPVPTSYMALGSAQDHFGGYDHGARLGFVHVADHEISPGKKMWTWGDAPFGKAWERNLTDDDGPYIELMAGVYTDNQPDFAYLGAGETKTLTESWYPIHEIGPVLYADEHLAVSLVREDAGTSRIGVDVAETYPDARILVRRPDGTELTSTRTDLSPGTPTPLDLPDGCSPDDLVAYIQCPTRPDVEVPLAGPSDPDLVPEGELAVAPPHPEEVTSTDRLIRIAVYLDQYRHATRSSEPYLEEALRRDPEESRALLHLGRHAYDRGQIDTATDLLGRSANLATEWTSTPASGEAHYRLGLALERAGRPREAAPALATAMWDARWAVAARFALARVRLASGKNDRAVELLREALTIDPHHHRSANLLALLEAALGNGQAADDLTTAVLAEDPLDAWALDIRGQEPTTDATILLDIALEYVTAGLVDEARSVLDRTVMLSGSRPSGQVNAGTLALLHLAALELRADDEDAARRALDRAQALDVTSAHPSRLDDAQALQQLADAFPDHPLPSALLGHWFYDRGRHQDAITSWEASLQAGAGPGLAAVLHRNLGIAAFNVLRDPEAAVGHYERAIEISGGDATLVFEADLLAARTGVPAAERLRRLEQTPQLLADRDDLVIAWVGLLLDVGRVDEARKIMVERRFQPWEGGEGQVLAAWDRANIALSRTLVEAGDPGRAAEVLRTSFEVPENLGEDRHPLANVAALSLALGDALAACGRHEEATGFWEQAARSTGDFVQMEQTAYGVDALDAARGLARLGKDAEAGALVADVRRWVEQYAVQDVEVDYFATSLPDLLVFHEAPEVGRDRAVAALRDALDAWDQHRAG